jgi:hypothetical protein
MRFLVKGETPAWRRLVAPFHYLAITHDIKFRFDWGWPLILAAITMAVFWLLPAKPAILGDAGFLKGIRDLIALLAAFFVASLAAVATFARASLDKPMEGTTPQLRGKPLTRRQFVCYLFGYLAILSFVLFLIAVIAQIIAPSLHLLFSEKWLWWVKAIGGSIFAFGFWNMMITTMLGVYFLVERVNLADDDLTEGNVPRDGDQPRRGGRRVA